MGDCRRARVASARRTWATSITVATCIGAASPAAGQDLEPRSFSNTPVGLNFLLAGYTFVDGDVGFSPSLRIEQAELRTHSVAFAYVRGIDVAGMSGKIGFIAPFATLSGTAERGGQRQTRDTSGFGDPKARFSVNFFGAPALSLTEFRDWRQDLIIGAAFEVAAPLGEYNPDKAVNIGTNRWSLRSELGASKAIGRLTMEASAAVTVYTANDDFFGGQTLRQDPLFAGRTHLIYQLAPFLWSSFDATYYNGAESEIDGVKGDGLDDARLGLTVSVDVSRHNSVKFSASTSVHSGEGSGFDAVGVTFQRRWGAGL